MGSILIIDDQKDLCESITALADRMGHTVEYCHTRREGLKTARSYQFDLILLDVRLPDGNGLDILPKLREITPAPEVIILTGYGDPSGAELAIRSGAWDYIEKPSSIKQIRLALERAMHFQEEKSRRHQITSLDRAGIVGNSVLIRECLDLVAKAAVSKADVLIIGETGTGKELFAKAVHLNSKRADKNFVVVDCAALPKDLVESMLFGHEKGSFTGAARSQKGLVEQADGGTLFLDEVAELPLALQKKFLRVLQERKYRPLGSQQEYSSDFRLVAATNKQLDQLVDEGLFREDLFFRLRSIPINLPPLRLRKDDIKPLGLHHISNLCSLYNTSTKGFSSDFFEVLEKYDWPGNVRELNQALSKALVAAGPHPVLFPKDLPLDIRAEVAKTSITQSSDHTETASEKQQIQTENGLPTLQEMRNRAIMDTERRYLEQLMKTVEGDIPRACAVADLSRSRLYALLKKYNI